jgi:Flp pilus assembly protein CpaB
MTHMSYRLRNLTLALALGILATSAALVFAAHGNGRHSTLTTQAVPVLVAAKNIAIGTPGSALQAGALKRVSVAKADRMPGAVTNSVQIARLVVTQPIYAGEQIATQRFGVAGQQGIRSSLTASLRLIQLPGDANQLLAGTLAAGDHVDVAASILNPETGEAHYTNIVLRNLLVVSAPSGSNSLSVSGKTDLSVDLELTDAQADRLFWVEKNAGWTLLLRPSVGASDGPAIVQSSASVLSGNRGR